MLSILIANIAAVIPMSAATKEMVIAYINAGATAASIIALLGGGSLIAFIIKKHLRRVLQKL